MLAVLAFAVLLAVTAPLVVLAFAVGLIQAERDACAVERAAWAQERQTLLQRIQAPQQAVAEHTQQVFTEPAPRPALTDDEHWDASGLQLSKDDLAEQTYAAELA